MRRERNPLCSLRETLARICGHKPISTRYTGGLLTPEILLPSLDEEGEVDVQRTEDELAQTL